MYKEVVAEDLNELAEESIAVEPSIPADCKNNLLVDDAVESPVDMLINAEVMLPSVKNDGTSILFCVKNGSCIEEGECIGQYNENPLLNTQVYELEDSDGNVQEYSANIIAQNIYENCDHEGLRWNTVVEIVGHNQADNAVKKDNQWVYYKGRKHCRQRKTTVGWKLWCRLSDLMEHINGLT